MHRYSDLTDDFVTASRLAVSNVPGLGWEDVANKLSDNPNRKTGARVTNGWQKINKAATTINGIRHQLKCLRIFSDLVEWEYSDCLILYKRHLVLALERKKVDRVKKIDQIINFILGDV